MEGTKYILRKWKKRMINEKQSVLTWTQRTTLAYRTCILLQIKSNVKIWGHY
jgi:hypothetical protein